MFLVHGQAHMGQMGKGPCQCTPTGLDNSTELRTEKIRQVVTEIWVPQVWQPPARPSGLWPYRASPEGWWVKMCRLRFAPGKEEWINFSIWNMSVNSFTLESTMFSTFPPYIRRKIIRRANPGIQELRMPGWLCAVRWNDTLSWKMHLRCLLEEAMILVWRKSRSSLALYHICNEGIRV